MLGKVIACTTSESASVAFDASVYRRLTAECETSGMAGFCYATDSFGASSATVHSYPSLVESDFEWASDVGRGSSGYGDIWAMRRLTLAQRLYGDDETGRTVVIEACELDESIVVPREQAALT